LVQADLQIFQPISASAGTILSIIRLGSDKLTKDALGPSRRGDATINEQQQVKQSRRGKMSRRLDGRGPTCMHRHQQGYSLSFTPKLLSGVQILKLWMARYASTVLQSRLHDPIMIHQHINVSPLTWELHSLIHAIFS